MAWQVYRNDVPFFRQVPTQRFTDNVPFRLVSHPSMKQQQSLCPLRRVLFDVLLYRQLEISGNLHLAALLKPIVLITKIIVAVVAALVWAHNAGFNISTLIAGLGVGSLAIALAAQRTMENVIGAATLYAARPIRPGDLCRFGDITGVVEEIGLRSVTLRSLDRTLVSIPNSKFAAEQIENISVRDRIRFFKRLQLQMPTSEQLRG